MKQPLVSIIIPVYNAEAYLSRCIDSLLAQTMQDFEIILVNDGSQDSSGSICEKYAENDNRIQVIHQQNSGVAAARQKGIDSVSGVYSIHIDPDDWVEPTMIEELYAKAMNDNADMVICDFLVESATGSRYLSQQVDSYDATNLLECLMYGKIHGSLCNKLIRTSLYKKLDIHFIEGINYCEDFLICARLFLSGIRVTNLPKAFYHYDQVVNDSSTTSKYNRNTLDMRLRFFNVLKELVGDENRALSHVITDIAVECYYYKALSSTEFAKVFGCYRKDFFRSKFKFKRKLKLCMITLGLLK